MPKLNINLSAVRTARPFNPKMIIGLFAAILLLLGLLLVAQGFVDTRNYQQRIRQIIKERTGKDAIITGRVSVSLVPVPTIYIPGLELRDANTASPSPALTVEMVEVKASFFSVLSGHPEISAIELQRPLLEVMRAENNAIRWDWLNGNLFTQGVSGNARAIAVSISGGRILYRNEHSDKDVLVQDIGANFMVGPHPAMRGSFSLYNHNFQLDANTAATDKSPLPEGTMPLNLKLYTDAKNILQLQGSIDTHGDSPKIAGALSLQAENLLSWGPQVESKKGIFSQFTNRYLAEKEEKAVLPVKFSGKAALDGWKINLSDIQFDGLNSAGAGKVSIAWDKQIPSIEADTQFSALNVNQWQILGAKIWEATRKEVTGVNVYSANEIGGNNVLPKDLQVTLKLEADRVYYGSQTWDKAQLKAELADNVITIDQLGILLPGNSTMTLFGIISQAATSGDMRFEGSMETQGKSLRKLLTIFDESASNLPETGFGSFFAHSNIFISTEQVRLSEADVKIDELHLNGGLVAYLDANPRLEAAVRLKDINFDYFRDVWRDNQKKAGKNEFFLKFDKSANFDWLKKLKTLIDFRLSVDHFTFLDRSGTNASFRIVARENEFGIYDVRLNYPNDTSEGNFMLNVKGDQPLISIVLNAGELNSSYFSVDGGAQPPPVTPAAPAGNGPTVPPTPAVPAIPAAGALPDKKLPDGSMLKITPQSETVKDVIGPPEKIRWSEKLIDMSWMDGFAADLDLSVGKLTIGDKKFDSVKFKCKLENNQLTFQGLTFIYWQGKFDIAGALYGGEVPGLSLGFTVYNAELHDIIESLSERTNIAGRVSISGTMATSGVNIRSWVEQADSKLVMAARGVKVEGFNMPAMLEAVAVSRTAADVFTNVNLAMTKGSTVFSVDGNLNIKGGVIRTPGITLKTGPTIGNLTGELRLIPWTMALNTLFQFPSLSSETIPTMPVQLVGPIVTPEIRIDTASLEAYKSNNVRQVDK